MASAGSPGVIRVIARLEAQALRDWLRNHSIWSSGKPAKAGTFSNSAICVIGLCSNIDE